MALEKLEMHDIQDKTRLLDEMNETREGVNEVKAELKNTKAMVRVLEKKYKDLKAMVENQMKAPRGGGKPN